MNPRKVCDFHRFGSLLDFHQHGRERWKSHSADFDVDDDQTSESSRPWP